MDWLKQWKNLFHLRRQAVHKLRQLTEKVARASESFSALDYRCEFLLQKAHGFLAIEEDSGRTESAVHKWTIGPCKKYGDLGTAHRTGGCPNLPQGRLHHYRLRFIVVFGIVLALAREASDPIALICYARFHKSSVLEIDL